MNSLLLWTLLTFPQIEADNDPRNYHLRNDDDNTDEFNRDRLSHTPTPPLSPFHTHNPWAHTGLHDHTDGGVSHSEWNPAPGIHFSRTSYRSTSPQARPSPVTNDSFGPFFQSFSAMLNGPGLQQPNRHAFRHHLPSRRNGSAPTSPLQEGPSRHGFAGVPRSMPGSFPLAPRDANNAQPNATPVDNLQGLLRTLIRGMEDIHVDPGAHGNQAFPPLHFFNHFLNPANAQHGDAVYTEEALDRIISQIMEAQNGQGAPGPATEDAIAALPKKKADESILGPEGKAECSVCMDNVTTGDEVTVLPCSHWFHGDCVGAWLKEHDTCPHCRQGIMAKEDGDHTNAANGPRQPGQEPRHSQPPLSTPGGNNGFRYAWRRDQQAGSPSSLSPQPPGAWSRHEGRSRRRSSARDTRGSGASSSSSSGGGNAGGGITGWMRSRFGGGSNHD